jgi:hypothetical protein
MSLNKEQADGSVAVRSPSVPSYNAAMNRSSLYSLDTTNSMTLEDDLNQGGRKYSMEDPVIDSPTSDNPDVNNYSAFTSWKKRFILAIVSLAHLISPVSGMSFLLALNPMREVSAIKIDHLG